MVYCSNGWQDDLDSRLAKRWSDFVDCEARLVMERPFLKEVCGLYREPNILDAAMGIGCETIWLAECGLPVHGNEIGEELRRIAIDRATEKKLNISTSSVDWRELAGHFPPKSFDIVLLLGNSFSLLRNRRDRARAATNLRSLCKDDGRVIVDERNFQYITGNREAILGGQFRYSGKVMYCGTRVIGRPILIEDDCVRFGYFDAASEEQIGALDMHPFVQGELPSLFAEAGFSRFQMYSDFQQEYDRRADFYTYIFAP